MEKKLNPQEFENLVKKLMLKELKSKPIKENFNEDDDVLGIFNGGFDADEFKGPAMKAAMQDMGKDFVPLGKSKFEKGMDTDEFVADLNRQNLNLPKDKEERTRLQKTLDTKKAHEKKFGAGTLNETGEWADDEEGIAWKDSLKGELEMLNNMLLPGIPFAIKSIEGFDKYIGPYAIVEIAGKKYKVWTTEENKLWIENFPIDNTSKKGQKAGFEGNPMQIASTINFHHSVLSPKNMNEDEHETWTREDEAKYEEELAQKMFNNLSNEAYSPDENDAHISNIAIKRMFADGLLDHDNDVDHDENGGATGSVEYFWFNDKGRMEITSPQDIIDGYFYSSGPDTEWEKEKAYFRGSEGNGGMDENENLPTKIDRPVDAEGSPITLRAIVKDLVTDSIGRVVRFGVDDEGKQTVHIDWVQKFGGEVPKSITYPDRIVVRDENRVVREEEMEEGIGHSLTIGKGQNAKPGNYPQTLKRVGMNENLDNATTIDNEVFLVTDNPFNRTHYADLVGKTFPDAPGYAKTKVIKPEDIEAEKLIKYDDEGKQITSEEFDFPTAERDFHNQETHEEAQSLVGKHIQIQNMDDIKNLLFQNHKRIHSILESIKEEVESHRVFNNTIVATDNMDTQWIFEIASVDDTTVTLQFTGTAK